MSVIIKVIGSNPDSDEYHGAIYLKRVLENGLPHNALGEITLHANATLVGQTIKDIDILMFGTLQNCSATVNFTGPDNKNVKEKVVFRSFCTAIEIKSHDVSGIILEGTEFYVKYGGSLHAATTQSNAQKISVKNYLERSIGCSPFVTNMLWFTGISSEELNELLSTGYGIKPANVLPKTFSIQELFQVLVWQKQPKAFHGTYYFDCCRNAISVEDLGKVFHKFSLAKSGMGALTRKRIEQIVSKTIKHSIKKPVKGKLSIYRGRAGTGKTVGLIQLAITLVDEDDARVLILTYNNALVSDIRRLLALAELPDLFSPSCVSICTMHSFFFRIVNDVLFNGTLEGEKFINQYEEVLSDLLDFLEGGSEAVELVYETMHCNDYLNWDYCMIDEAQDWLKVEQDIILKLFAPEKIVVADGGQQFVRRIQAGDWTARPNRNSTKLKLCMRQKSNIIQFINRYLDELGKREYRLSDPGNLAGGKVIICSEEKKHFRLFQEELENLKLAGNIPYDMLFLVPNSMVNREPRRFSEKELFNEHGFSLWDGTNENERKTYSRLGDEVRVLQYDSARGLEAWTVICIALDQFIEEKIKTCTLPQPNSLYLESEEDLRIRNMINWLLIPFTRAIDTLIITISDWNSQTGTILKKLAKENPDYVRQMEDCN